MLYVDEVFASIQGESTDAGLPCTFIRLYGCPFKCSFCDQPQQKENRTSMQVEALINKVAKLGIKNVCITGGEPLIQTDLYPLVYDLLINKYNVSIETSGLMPIEADPYNRSFKYIMDIKCPSSGVSKDNVFENLAILQPKDEVKFVIGDREDYEFAKSVMMKYPTSAKILFSPVFDKDNKTVIGNSLVDWILEDKLHTVRVQIQMHKCLGVR